MFGSAYSPAVMSGKLMENLYPYMEADEEFRIEDYYENILESFEMNGALYVMPAEFTVDTMAGKAAELGAWRGRTESWEVGEMISAFAASPHAEYLTVNHSKRLTFTEICCSSIGNYVDWAEGECRFDTPEFVELLEFSDTFPDNFLIGEDFSYREACEGGQIFLKPVYLSSSWDVAEVNALFGGDVQWPGYPVADGEKALGGGIARPGGMTLSICAAGTHKEAAWEFIKSFLTPQAQRDMGGIPILKSASEERIMEALEPQEEIRDTLPVEGDEPIELSSITQEDAEAFRGIIADTHRSVGLDEGMYEIIMEEADAYFEKGKDAETVAQTIQNRVSVYVWERMN